MGRELSRAFKVNLIFKLLYGGALLLRDVLIWFI